MNMAASLVWETASIIMRTLYTERWCIKKLQKRNSLSLIISPIVVSHPGVSLPAIVGIVPECRGRCINSILHKRMFPNFPEKTRVGSTRSGSFILSSFIWSFWRNARIRTFSRSGGTLLFFSHGIMLRGRIFSFHSRARFAAAAAATARHEDYTVQCEHTNLMQKEATHSESLASNSPPSNSLSINSSSNSRLAKEFSSSQ